MRLGARSYRGGHGLTGPISLGRTHSVLSVALVAVVASAIVPLGSNRPFFWGFWASLLGAIAVLYGLALLVKQAPFRVAPKSMLALGGLYVALLAALMVQLLPLGQRYWGPGIETPSGHILSPAFVSVTPGDTVLMLMRWLGYGLMFFLTAQVARNARRRLNILVTLAAVLAAHAAFALLSFHQLGNTLLGAEKWAHLDSVTGTFANRNSFATLMALGLTLVTALGAQAIESARGAQLITRLSAVALAGLLFSGALLGSNSRMGLLVGVLGPLVVLASWLTAASSPARRRLLIPLAVLALAIAVFGGVYFRSDVWLRLFELESSGAVRGELYAQVWDMIQHAPWLGFGGGSFPEAFQLFHRPALAIDLVWDRAHNSYLALWAEMGFLAGSLPLAMVAVLSWGAIRAKRATGRADAVSSTWLGATAVAGVHSLVDFSLEMYAVALVFAMLAGLCFAASQTEKPRL